LVRNTILFHRFPVFITSSGWVFWTGNNPYATGSYSLPDGRAVLTATPESFQEQLTQLDELGQARLFSQEAWRYIRAHPFRTLWLDMKKFYSFWWFSPFTGKGYYPMAYLHWYRWYYGLISALALVYLWINRRRLWEIPFVVLLGYALSIATFQSFYYVEGRNRWTVEPVLLLLAAGGTLCVRDRLRTRMAVIG